MVATFSPFIKTGPEDGSYLASLGEVKGTVVAGGGLADKTTSSPATMSIGGSLMDNYKGSERCSHRKC